MILTNWRFIEVFLPKNMPDSTQQASATPPEKRKFDLELKNYLRKFRKMINSQSKEKRSYRRLDMSLPLEYRKPKNENCNFLRSITKNVSTGGVYFETTDDSLKAGDILTFELGIPEGDNRFPKHGTISTTGKITRLTSIAINGDQSPSRLSRFGVAASFQKGFKLEF